MKTSKLLLRLLCCLVLMALASCDLNVQPYTGKPTEEALNSIEGLQAATLGDYDIIQGYIRKIFYSSAFGSDDVSLSGTTSDHIFYFYNYSHFAEMEDIPVIWREAYQVIYGASQIIEHIEEGASPELKQLKGENLFLRALMHFQLVRLFGRPYPQGRDNPGIPIVNSTEFVDKLPARSTVGEVYDFIVADLRKAAELMTLPQPNTRASKEAAWALLSRVYLYMEENEKAIEYANEVIDSDRYHLVDTETLKHYSESPPEDNPETIFAIKFTPAENLGQSAPCAMYYATEGGVGWGEMYASKSYRELLNKYPEDARHAFIEPQYERDVNGDIIRDENGDPVLQKRNGLPKYFIDKLCFQGGLPMLWSPVILRLAEIYLNRAEAYAKLGQYEKAIADVNRIRRRAGLSGDALYSVGDLKWNDTVLDVILEERRLELFLEGHRKYDLFRNGRPMVRDYPGYHLVEGVPGVNLQAGTQIIPPDHPRVVYYIPAREIQLNPNLEQNP